MAPKFFNTLLILSLFLFLASCHSTRGSIEIDTSRKPSQPPSTYGKKKKHGPPAHAAAHGYRAKHTYRYYATVRVYYDLGRRLYFYLEGQHWRRSASLPRHLRARLDSDYVLIEMNTDKPYTQHAKHKKHHPPGKTKKYKADKNHSHKEKNKNYKTAKKHKHPGKSKNYKTAKKHQSK